MSGKDDRRQRRIDALALAGELGRLADGYRGVLAGTIGAHDLDHALDRAVAHARDLDPDLASDLEPELVGDRTRYIDHAFARSIHRALARALDRRALILRSMYGGGRIGPTCEASAERRLLSCLAGVLPAAERSRFVAEAQGNLGDCERRWQRIDHLVWLAIGMPRLAWMMWRDGRRGRV